MNYKILKDNVIVIIGGGITGLLAGLIWAEQKRYKVIIIEKNRDVGGLLGKINYKNYGIFDIGMHTMFDTGNKDLDKLLFSLLPEKKWQISKGFGK